MNRTPAGSRAVTEQLIHEAMMTDPSLPAAGGRARRRPAAGWELVCCHAPGRYPGTTTLTLTGTCDLTKAVGDVLEEHARAAAEHGPTYSSLHETYGVLYEEVEEFFEAVRLKTISPQGARLRAARAELVQVAAVALKGIVTCDLKLREKKGGSNGRKGRSVPGRV